MNAFMPKSVVRGAWPVVGLALVMGSLPMLGSAADEPRTNDKGQMTKDDVQDVVFLSETRPVLLRLHIQNEGKPLQTAWREFIEHLFKTIDRDGDGMLNAREVERIPALQASIGAGAIAGPLTPTVLLDMLDRDKDGKVSQEELANYYRRTSGAPFQIVSGNTASLPQAAVIDFPGPRQVFSAEAINEAFFNLLDANKDGKLSREELAAAPTALMKLDANDDEVVSVQELVPSSNDPRAPVAATSGFAVTGPAPPDRASFVAIGPDGLGANIARVLQARYGPKGTRSGGMGLTQKDLGLSDGTFKQLDADENGELDAEELARFGHRPADVELVVRLGKSADAKNALELVSAAGRTSPLAASLHKHADGSVQLDIGTTRLQLRISAGDARQPAVITNRQIYKMQFTAADQDNNGYLDSTEAQRIPLFRNAFKAMDRDGDGKLTEKEMTEYLDEIQDLQTRARAASVSLSLSEQGRGLFDLLDTNRDGRLGVRELRQAVNLLATLDRGDDGQLDRSEIPHSYQALLGQGGVNLSSLNARVIVASAMGGPAPAPPTPTTGPLWFRKMDRNRDGDVSRREFLGTDEEFARLDTDGDGLISVAEAIRADPRIGPKDKQ